MDFEKPDTSLDGTAALRDFGSLSLLSKSVSPMFTKLLFSCSELVGRNACASTAESSISSNFLSSQKADPGKIIKTDSMTLPAKKRRFRFISDPFFLYFNRSIFTLKMRISWIDSICGCLQPFIAPNSQQAHNPSERSQFMQPQTIKCD